MRLGRLVAVAGSALLINTVSWTLVGAPRVGGDAAVLVASAEPSRPAVTVTTPAVPLRVADPETVVASEDSTSAEMAAAFLADINELRASHGLRPLRNDDVLASAAAGWAAVMAEGNDLRHSELIYEVVAKDWTAAGENVGYGPTEAVIFEALASSPAHNDNMINPRYTHAGIAVFVVGPVVWTAHLFAG